MPKRTSDKRFECVDCGVDTSNKTRREAIGEFYMVTNKVWAESALGPSDGMLCIGCLELRIGRLLQPEDFIACPLNVTWTNYRSKRLLERMGF